MGNQTRRNVLQWGWAYGAIALVLLLVWVEFLRGRGGEWAARAGGGASGEPAATAPAAPPLPQDPELALIRIARDLASGNVGEKQFAQLALADVSHRQRELLRRLVGDANDPDARARLQARLAELDEQVARNPPPVTLQVRDTSLFDVASELQAELGVPVRAVATARMQGRYTLDVADQPFWDVLAALNRQSALSIVPGYEFTLQEHPGRSGRVVTGNPRMTHLATEGHFAVFADVMGTVPTARAATASRFVLSYTLLADPRVHLLELAPTLVIGPDDAGNHFTSTDANVTTSAPRGRAAAAGAAVPRLAGNGLTQQVQLTGVARPGARITQVQFNTRAVTALATASLTVHDALTREGQTVNVGRTAVTLRQFRMERNRLQVGLISRLDGQTPYAIYRIVDSAGRLRLTFSSTGTATAALPGPIPTPIQLQIDAPQRVEESRVTLVLKDLPLNR